MNKIFSFILAALFATTANAVPEHWVCSNDTSVMYLVLDPTDGTFMLWNDTGQFLAAAKLTSKTVAPNGIPVLIARLENDTLIGIARTKDSEITIAISPNDKKPPLRMNCR